MANKEAAALKRLTKKLSAMRATLSKDERVLLDKLILGQEVEAHRIHSPKRSLKMWNAETQAHAMTTGKAMKATKAMDAETQAHAMTTGKAMKATKAMDAETQAHAMTTGKAMKATKVMDAETQAHQMTSPKKASKVTRVHQPESSAPNQMISFDPMTGGYKVDERFIR